MSKRHFGSSEHGCDDNFRKSSSLLGQSIFTSRMQNTQFYSFFEELSEDDCSNLVDEILSTENRGGA